MSRWSFLKAEIEPGRLLTRRNLATSGTVLFALVAIGGLGAAFDNASSMNSDRAELQGRLDALMARPLPQMPVEAKTDAARDNRIYRGETQGAVVSTLQDRISAIVDAAGLRLRRISAEPNTSEADKDRIVIRVEADGGVDALQAALFQIETSVPYLFVDTLDVQRSGAEGGDRLDIKATVLADWREEKP